MDILFLDANVMFSAAYHRDAGLRRLWRLDDVELISSLYAVDETFVSGSECRSALDVIELRCALAACD